MVEDQRASGSGSTRREEESPWMKHVSEFRGTDASRLLAGMQADMDRMGAESRRRVSYADSGREGRIRRGVCDEGHMVLNALHPEVDAAMNSASARKRRESSHSYGMQQKSWAWSGETLQPPINGRAERGGSILCPGRNDARGWDEDKIQRDARQREWRAVGSEALELLAVRRTLSPCVKCKAFYINLPSPHTLGPPLDSEQ